MLIEDIGCVPSLILVVRVIVFGRQGRGDLEEGVFVCVCVCVCGVGGVGGLSFNSISSDLSAVE